MSARQFGILAEDQTDCDAIGVLVRRIAGEIFNAQVSIRRRSGKGCAKVRKKAEAWMKELAREDCQAVILVHDLDRSPTNVLNDEEALRQRLAQIDVPEGVERLICIPIEELEAWFWSDPEVVRIVGRGTGNAHPEPHRIAKPKELLMKLSASANKKPRYFTGDNVDLAEKLNIDLCARRCAAFLHLRNFVAKVVSS
ncbi:DUF4276 family protein [Sorangium sp. KYC3313]|uniref:DUF4276 family protein n=1 Tax=Sorangium sp. KYC3313 TaxID=3449740 RepID=UPI003F8C17CF